MLVYLYQDDKDLVPEFVNSEGLTCFIKVGAEADHNYQNYILRGTFTFSHLADALIQRLTVSTGTFPRGKCLAQGHNVISHGQESDRKPSDLRARFPNR